MQILAPIAVKTVPFKIKLDDLSIDRTAIAAVLLTNTSPIFFIVTFGSGSDYLEAGRSDLFAVNGPTIKEINLNPQAGTTGTGFIYVTIFNVNDQVTKTYPTTVPLGG